MQEICQKLRTGTRLDRQDGLQLANCSDLHSLGTLALAAKRNKSQDRAYYIINRHINYSNICKNICKICYFYRDRNDPQAFTLDIEQVLAIAQDAVSQDATELHIIGGINPYLPYDYYIDLVTRLHNRWGNLAIKAFTAPEIDHLAEISGKTVQQVLGELKGAGLTCLPGGGAEIFNHAVRQEGFPRKITADRWLQVHRTAHQLGIRSTATMLFGHFEAREHRVDHLLALRQLQDQTGGFLAMVPLPFQPLGSQCQEPGHCLPAAGPGGLEILRTFALCRLMLDNFDHIKAFWPICSLKLAELALQFGADDLDGTVGRYKIVSEIQNNTGTSPERLCRTIRQGGLKPVLRDSFYRPIQ